MSETVSVMTEPPAIPMSDEMRAAVNETLRKHFSIGISIADDFLALGFEQHIAFNLAINALITSAARIGVLSARDIEGREPRRDWWLYHANKHFDEALEWFADAEAKGLVDDDPETCVACNEELEDGDLVYWENGEGSHIHASCCGPERESYCGVDGEPLEDGEPIPEPFVYRTESANG